MPILRELFSTLESLREDQTGLLRTLQYSFRFTLFRDKEGRAFVWSLVKSKGASEPEVTHDGGAVVVKNYLRNGKALGRLRPRGNSFICPSPVTRV